MIWATDGVTAAKAKHTTMAEILIMFIPRITDAFSSSRIHQNALRILQQVSARGDALLCRSASSWPMHGVSSTRQKKVNPGPAGGAGPGFGGWGDRLDRDQNL